MSIFSDLPALIKTVGYLGLFGITFAESGLFIGFMLPGDSLLFTAGFLASQKYLTIHWLIITVCAGAILGDNFGYAFGKKVGPKIFTKEDSLLFHRDHLFKAQKFYEEHGGKTLILARFMPVVRTFAPILAGVGKMPYRTFLVYNIVGGLLWGISLPLAGYFLGTLIPDAEKYVHWIILGIIFVSLLPTAIHVLKTPSDRARIWGIVKKIFARKPKSP